MQNSKRSLQNILIKQLIPLCRVHKLTGRAEQDRSLQNILIKQLIPLCSVHKLTGSAEQDRTLQNIFLKQLIPLCIVHKLTVSAEQERSLQNKLIQLEKLEKRDMIANMSMSVSFEHKSSKCFLESFIT